MENSLEVPTVRVLAIGRVVYRYGDGCLHSRHCTSPKTPQWRGSDQDPAAMLFYLNMAGSWKKRIFPRHRYGFFCKITGVLVWDYTRAIHRVKKCVQDGLHVEKGYTPEA